MKAILVDHYKVRRRVNLTRASQRSIKWVKHALIEPVGRYLGTIVDLHRRQSVRRIHYLLFRLFLNFF